MTHRKGTTLRICLVLAGLAAGLAAAEMSLRAAGLPRFYSAPRELTPRFVFTGESTNGIPVHLNAHATAIRFRYDGNPRGYFDENNELAHWTNKAGFRGGEFVTVKQPDTVRIAFLGDSFVFGEGVRFEDTLPERAAALLRKKHGGVSIECYNFGVGGYNTTQSLYALRKWALVCQPDIVVLGFNLNDAELPLYAIDPQTEKPERRPREAEIPESLDDLRPPDSPLYSLAAARLLWKRSAGRRRADRIIGFYRRLYSAKQPGWQTCKHDLRAMAEVCRWRGIPFVVVQFPALADLNDRYPFVDIHGAIRNEVEAVSATFVDLLPEFKAHNAADLWVHPADQHPNNIAHNIAAEALVRKLEELGTVSRVLVKRSSTATVEQK